ncbi:DUF5125 domain-containing protein [Bacteroides pyogenes]|uniref:DUF5125 domain-containing protein n=1 Tax=Bacteroides pyogenes TaxID=310300 RepID=UPI001F223064|nr:DUF5125 domain-containing protein [Bacteroides pyogenes]
MKMLIYRILFLFSFLWLTSCSNDEGTKIGNPTMEIKSEIGTAMYGDSLSFKVDVLDEVPLSTLKARLYFGTEQVSEVVLRTKTTGSYEGKIYVPFYKNVPDGKAMLEFVLQNINFTINTVTRDLQVKRAVYPHLILVTDDGEYRMMHTEGHNYVLTATLPQKLKGYIKTPKLSTDGNELTFGWEGDGIVFGSTEPIPFSNRTAGEYTVSFNTLDFAASPFLIAYAVNGTEMEKMNEGNSEDRYKLDLSLTQGGEISMDGIADFGEWWIDPDFFDKAGEKLTFKPISGEYRLIADFNRRYLKVEARAGEEFASLQSDGSGALWIVGEGAGKPALKYMPSWNPNMAICMAPMGGGKYVANFVAGQTIGTTSINFVIIHQKGWGAGFKGDEAASGGNLPLEVVSDLIFIGKGKGVNGADDGNLTLLPGKSLIEGKTYLFELVVPDGLVGCKFTVTEK